MNPCYAPAMGLTLLRVTGWLEGLSFLVLLFVGMPLKYVWDEPLGVRVAGPAHGVLFVLFVSLVFHVGSGLGWSARKMGLAVLAAFLPFGPFVFDRHLRAESPATDRA